MVGGWVVTLHLDKSLNILSFFDVTPKIGSIVLEDFLGLKRV